MSNCPAKPENREGSPDEKQESDSVAQSVEQLPFKPWVRGSSPRWVTTGKGHLRSRCPFPVGSAAQRAAPPFSFKCSAEMNSACAILRRLWRLRIYGALAPPARRPVLSFCGACIFFINTGQLVASVISLAASFFLLGQSSSRAHSAAPRFQTATASLGSQLVCRPAGGFLACIRACIFFSTQDKTKGHSLGCPFRLAFAAPAAEKGLIIPAGLRII